jgi:hypothetical protein
LISEIMQHQPVVYEVPDSEADTEADTAQHST